MSMSKAKKMTRKSTKSNRRSKKSLPQRFIDRLQLPAKVAFGREKLDELVRVYEDLEQTLSGLKRSKRLQGHNPLTQINLQKLITQLSKSKRDLEHKIGTALVSEREHLMQTLGKFSRRNLKKRSTPTQPTSFQS